MQGIDEEYNTLILDGRDSCWMHWIDSMCMRLMIYAMY